VKVHRIITYEGPSKALAAQLSRSLPDGTQVFAWGTLTIVTLKGLSWWWRLLEIGRAVFATPSLDNPGVEGDILMKGNLK